MYKYISGRIIMLKLLKKLFTAPKNVDRSEHRCATTKYEDLCQ